MAITQIENPVYDVLKQLKEENKYARISYHGEKGATYIGKINELTKRDILLLPYIVWENVPTPNIDQFLNRCRIEKKISKPIPVINAIPEPLSDGYIDYYVRWINYFSARIIKDTTLRNSLFDKKIYPLPTKKEIETVEKSLIKKSGN